MTSTLPIRKHGRTRVEERGEGEEGNTFCMPGPKPEGSDAIAHIVFFVFGARRDELLTSLCDVNPPWQTMHHGLGNRRRRLQRLYMRGLRAVCISIAQIIGRNLEIGMKAAGPTSLPLTSSTEIASIRILTSA